MIYNRSETTGMLEAILDSIDEAIHVVDENGVTIYYNKVAASHDGLAMGEVVGKHLLEVFPSLCEETSTLLKVISIKKPIYNQHQTYQNLRGEVVDTVNTTIPIFSNEKIIGAVEIARNLTKVKKLSEKLLDLEARIHTNKKQKLQLHNENAKFQLTDIITANKHMEQLKEAALKVAATPSPILVCGETGTGKELFVQAIHNSSPRREEPFIAQNCAAIPSSLLEGILFGTTKGSFTGAVDRAGLFELAHGGTLFLDEINSMPLDLQAKLLRALEDGVIRRVGNTNGYSVNTRVIVAMNEDPLHCVKEEGLREDLYYRINVVSFHLPPLRDRKEDIALLTSHFIKKYNYKFQKLVTTINDDVSELFHSYHWPGNVRELEHIIEAAMNMVDSDTITYNHLPDYFLKRVNTKTSNKIQPLKETMEKTEIRLIQSALSETNWNIKEAAKLLCIPRQTLQYKISKYNLKGAE